LALAPGTRLGSYEIRFRLGAGGMGEVYRARDSRLDRDVAIKVLSDAVAGNPTALARFEREAKSVAALSHPNILAIHDVGREADVSFAVMELLEGESLAERIAQSRLSWRKRSRSGSRLRFYDFATRRSETVGTLGDVGFTGKLGEIDFSPGVSPDGRTVLYSRTDSTVDDLMLVENFR
jgi:hypothetical protein